MYETLLHIQCFTNTKDAMLPPLHLAIIISQSLAAVAKFVVSTVLFEFATDCVTWESHKRATAAFFYVLGIFLPLQVCPRNGDVIHHQNQESTLVGCCSRPCHHWPSGDGYRRNCHIPQHHNSSFRRFPFRVLPWIPFDKTNGRSKFVAGRNGRGKPSLAAAFPCSQISSRGS